MDPTTVIILLSLNLVGIGGLLLLIGRRMSDSAGLRGFATGSLAFGVAYLMRLLIGISSGHAIGVIADSCMIFATLSFATGLRQFSGGAPLGRRRVFTVTGLYAVTALVATLVWQGIGRHAMLNLSLAAAYALLANSAVTAARREVPKLRPPLRLLAGMLSVISVATAARGVALFWVGIDPLFHGPFAEAYYGYSIVFSTLLGPNLLWMVFVRLNDRLNEMAMRDPLTQLPNRHGMAETMQDLFSSDPPRPRVLMLVDVDHFKRINDTYGHSAGDGVLRGIAASLQAQVRGDDVVARWGGEEFLVCCDAADDSGIRLLAERLRVAIEAQDHVLADGRTLNCTVSIGVSAPFAGIAAWEECLRVADQALYEAKRGGRNRVNADPVASAASPHAFADRHPSGPRQAAVTPL